VNGPQIAIGSRGSQLALAQARLVEAALARRDRSSRIVVVETEGDRRAIDTAWGEGAFVAAIERALLAGRVDIAVHSAKDVPTDEDPRLRIAAYLPRADARDALVVRLDAAEGSLAELPSGARVGTDSPRRMGFLLARRPDLVVHPLHGNVDTRLRRLDAGETDALVLACAGLDRLGLGERIAERLEPDIVPPAPGQGAIAIQIRGDDTRLLEIVAAIDDRPTKQAVEAERLFLGASGGGCRSPIGSFATVGDGTLDILGGYATPDGARVAFAHRRGPITTAQDLASELAAELHHSSRPRASAEPGGASGDRRITRRVLVTRAADQAAELVSAIHDAGLEPVPVPAIAIELEPGAGDLDDAARSIGSYAWVVITSTNGARAILKAAERVFTPFEASRFAAIGPSTQRALEREGVDVHFVPSQRTASALAAELPLTQGDRVLVVRGDLADGQLASTFRALGAEVDEVIGYRTREAPEDSRERLRTAVSGGPIAAALFTSGSTVRGLLTLGHQESIDVRAFPAVCVGPQTADDAQAAGFRILAVSPMPDPAALATATADALARQAQETR
jgi:hydroxymethylbilane synthase